MISEIIGAVLAEVFEALFIAIGSSFRGRKHGNKKSGIKSNARPTLNGVPPDVDDYESAKDER